MQRQSRYRRLASHRPGVVRTILQRFVAENMMQTSAALAFTTLIALVPLVTVILSVAEAIPYLDALAGKLESLIRETLLPAGAANAISSSVGRFSHRAQQLTVAGILFLSITAFFLMHTIERAFNHVWQVEARPLVSRLLLYAFAMLVWPFILAAVAAIMSFAVSISLGFVSESQTFRASVLKAISVVVLGLFFTFLYRVVPNAPVRRSNALLGGVFATLAFSAMQKAFEVYLVGSALLKSVYGAFAAFPIFLVWLQLSWAVILFGGLIAATAFRSAPR